MSQRGTKSFKVFGFNVSFRSVSGYSGSVAKQVTVHDHETPAAIHATTRRTSTPRTFEGSQSEQPYQTQTHSSCTPGIAHSLSFFALLAVFETNLVVEASSIEVEPPSEGPTSCGPRHPTLHLFFEETPTRSNPEIRQAVGRTRSSKKSPLQAPHSIYIYIYIYIYMNLVITLQSHPRVTLYQKPESSRITTES